MLQLLSSRQVGTLDKDRSSNKYIYDRWKDSGLLVGLDREVTMKVVLAMEIGAEIILMENKSCDIISKITGDIFYYDSRFDTVIFPIIRRIIGITPEAIDFVPEIINEVKKYYKTPLAKVIHERDVPERHLEYLYNNVLVKWSKHHRESEYKNYEEFKKGVYNEYVKKQQNWGKEIEPFDAARFVDWEVEYCAALAEKIETEIREKLKIER